MAITWRTSGAVAYSSTAGGGTSVAPQYPVGLAQGDLLFLVVGQKPTTANGGTVTHPDSSVWTLRAERLAGGGYSTTTGADVGNTNIRVYTRSVPSGGLTGSLTVSVADNNVCWASMHAATSGTGNFTFLNAATGQDTNSGAAVSISTSPDPVFAAGDHALAIFCNPTDALTGFTAYSLSQTGVTFGSATQLSFADSGNGNDIGGFVFRTEVTAASGATGAVLINATASGTTTNARGPGAIVSIREAAAWSLSADAAAFTTDGQVATATFARLQSGDAATVTISGSNATVFRGRTWGLDAGTFALSNQSATLLCSGAPAFFVSNGSVVSTSTSDVTAAWPVGHQPGDLGLLMVETAAAQPPTVDGTWTLITAIDSGGSSDNRTRLEVYYKFAGSFNESGASVSRNSGDHAVAIIASFRGVATDNPWAATFGSAVELMSEVDNQIAYPSVTTTVDEARLVLIASRGYLGTFDFFFSSTLTNANLSSLTKQFEQGGVDGTYPIHGGGITLATGYKALSGNTGNTLQNVSPGAYSDFALLVLALRASSVLNIYSLDAQPGAFVLSGLAAELARVSAFALDAQPGAFSVFGADTTLIHSHFIEAEASSFIALGGDSTALHTRYVGAEFGSLALTGFAAELTKVNVYTLDAQPGAADLFGQPATLAYAQVREFHAEPGAFVLGGVDAALVKTNAYDLDGQPATFDLSGQAATLVHTQIRQLQAEAGAFNLYGLSATLTKVNVYTLEAQASVWTLAGQAAATARSQVMDAQAASYSWTLNSTSPYRGWALITQTGTLAVTGQDATLDLLDVFVLQGEVGFYASIGQAALIQRDKALQATTGSYSTTGEAAQIERTRLFQANVGNWTATGQSATLACGRHMPAMASSFAVSGSPAQLLRTFNLDTGFGSYGWQGQLAQVLFGRLVLSATGSYSIQGQDSSSLVAVAFELVNPYSVHASARPRHTRERRPTFFHQSPRSRVIHEAVQ